MDTPTASATRIISSTLVEILSRNVFTFFSSQWFSKLKCTSVELTIELFSKWQNSERIKWWICLFKRTRGVSQVISYSNKKKRKKETRRVNSDTVMRAMEYQVGRWRGETNYTDERFARVFERVSEWVKNDRERERERERTNLIILLSRV